MPKGQSKSDAVLPALWCTSMSVHLVDEVMDKDSVSTADLLSTDAMSSLTPHEIRLLVHRFRLRLARDIASSHQLRFQEVLPFIDRVSEQSLPETAGEAVMARMVAAIHKIVLSEPLHSQLDFLTIARAGSFRRALKDALDGRAVTDLVPILVVAFAGCMERRRSLSAAFDHNWTDLFNYCLDAAWVGSNDQQHLANHLRATLECPFSDILFPRAEHVMMLADQQTTHANEAVNVRALELAGTLLPQTVPRCYLRDAVRLSTIESTVVHTNAGLDAIEELLIALMPEVLQKLKQIRVIRSQFNWAFCVHCNFPSIGDSC